jgi:hypothetical protein
MLMVCNLLEDDFEPEVGGTAEVPKNETCDVTWK